jgi:hypothetical protein
MERGDVIERGIIEGVGWRRVYETEATEEVVYDDDTPNLGITAVEGPDGEPLPPAERGDLGPVIATHWDEYRAGRDDQDRRGAIEQVLGRLEADAADDATWSALTPIRRMQTTRLAVLVVAKLARLVLRRLDRA